MRSINSVECLFINGDVLDELWRRCSSSLRQQVESEAKRRLNAAKKDEDVVMTGIDGDGTEKEENMSWRDNLPTVHLDDSLRDELLPVPIIEPLDPDPFFNAELDNMRAKSRRASLAPPLQSDTVAAIESQRTPSPPNGRYMNSSPLKPRTPVSLHSPSSSLAISPNAMRRPGIDRSPSNAGKGRLPDQVLVLIFQQLDLMDLMRLRLVSMHWMKLLATSPDILHNLDLSHHNRRVTDETLRDVIIPFIGNRPKCIDLSNCYHVTDEGFRLLADACGDGVKVWKMKSVWDVTGQAVLGMVDKAKGLEEIDLSNCRKVGDNLLARVVGWVVPEKGFPEKPATNGSKGSEKRPASRRNNSGTAQSAPEPIAAPGTVVGASNLKRLTLSYCKHIQDRSMAHIAVHASERLESIDLTRCTSITDQGFHSWGVYDFKRLRKLVLADCTYLSDQAIVGVVGGCRGLQDLDLSFCCALSDTATEVLSLGLPSLRRLNLAFCGSAVSDSSLRCIGLHLLELRYLSVRGCVRVTGQGVEAVIEGCRGLQELDVSQCKNLRPWLERGGRERINAERKGGCIEFLTVADGTWRAGR